MKQLTKYIVGGLAALALVGCKDKMRELNTNPNTIGTTDPRYIFLSTTQDFESGRGIISNQYASTGVLMQYFVSYTGAANGSYCNQQALEFMQPASAGDAWGFFYGNSKQLVALQQYIDNIVAAELQPQYQDLRAVCGVLKIFQAFRVFADYGAAVYTQAFQANDGITKPAYDLFDNTIYEALDDELKGYIAVLAAAPALNTVELGLYDIFYGYQPSVSGAPITVTDYAAQRDRWKKFGNATRLEMAWRMKNVDATRFSQVLSEVTATPDQLMENAADGAFAFLNGYGQNGAIYNSDDVNKISVEYSVGHSFVTYLKQTNDPRLPLLARPNQLGEDNDNYQWVKTYFPDSLQLRQVFDKTSNTWSEQPWGTVLSDAIPLNRFQGQNTDPFGYNGSNPGHAWGQRSFSFHFYHPNYKPNDTEFNKTLGPWTVTSPTDGSTFTIINADTTLSVAVASRPQGRYFIACGGKTEGDGTTNGANGLDGSVANISSIYMSHPVYTYVEQCFMLAFLAVDNGSINGQTASQWYENGVRTAMAELQLDALRYQIQIATNIEYVKIPTINDNGVYDLTSKIDAYLAANSLDLAADKKEAIAAQMWVYCYNQPIKMWNWWRMTGYPKMVQVNSLAEEPGIPYLAKPYTRTAQEPLQYPRRCRLPQPNTMNNDNYNVMKTELVNLPNYGATIEETVGRIYWDVNGL